MTKSAQSVREKLLLVVRWFAVASIASAFFIANAEAGQLPSANRTGGGPPATSVRTAVPSAAPAAAAPSTKTIKAARENAVGQLPSANRSGGGGPVISGIR